MKASSKRGDRTRYPLPDPIDDGSRICVQLYIPNIAGHRQAFLGAIHNLTHWFSWEMDTAKQGRLAAAVWKPIFDDLLDRMYDDPCGGDLPCFTFPPSAPFIEWFPNNPYTEPDLVTEGYNSPAWYQATEASNLILGTQPGDIVTDLTRFPPGSLPTIIPASGLPRFRVHLSGQGLVRLHLLNILGGSLSQITIDDEITSVRFIDSNRDQLAVPFETATTSIEEIEVTGDGEHHIDVIIVSQINDEIPFLHHGGGLRKIEICQGAVEMPYFELRQNPDDPCLLEQRQNPNSEWFPAFDYGLCAPGAGAEQPTNERYNEDGIYQVSYDDGETWTDAPEKDERYSGVRDAPYGGTGANCLAALNIRAFMLSLVNEVLDGIANAGTIISIVALVGGFLILLFTGGAALPLVFPFVSFMLSIGLEGLTLAFTEDYWEEFLCVIICHIPADGVITTAVYDSIMADVESQTGVAWEAMLLALRILGPVGLDRAAHRGGIFETTEECDDCNCGNCSNLLNWGVVFGTIIEQTPGYLKIASAASGPNQAVRIATWATGGTNTDCCFVVGGAEEGGGAFTNTAYYPCGSDAPINSIPPGGVCGHDFQWSNVFNNSFVMEIHFSDCE